MKKNQNFQKKFKFSQKNRVSYIFLLVLVHSLLIFTNCKTIPTEKKQIQLSRKILGQGILNEFQLTSFFLSQNPDYNYEDMITFAGYYISEAAQENINSDVAFAQMCLETGYLRFGGGNRKLSSTTSWKPISFSSLMMEHSQVITWGSEGSSQ